MNDYADKKAEQDKKRRNYMKMLAFPGFVAGIADYTEPVKPLHERYLEDEKENQTEVQSDASIEPVVDDR